MVSGPSTSTVVPMTPLRLARKVLLTYLTLMGTVACLTILFLCARAVMEMGGSCASGGPYEVANPCPKGIGWMMTGSIFGGLIFLGLYIGNDSGLPGPKWWGFAWPALFLSLGWNFWEFGLNPPDSFGEGVEWGWIICGVIFVLMGGAPLLALFSKDGRRGLLWADGAGDGARPTPRQTVKAATPMVRPRTAATSSTSAARPSASAAPSDVTDMAEDLERLAELHRSGSLTTGEFEAAKARRIAGTAP